MSIIDDILQYGLHYVQETSKSFCTILKVWLEDSMIYSYLKLCLTCTYLEFFPYLKCTTVGFLFTLT